MLFEIYIYGAITTNLKSVVSSVCQIQGRSALRRPPTGGSAPKRKMAFSYIIFERFFIEKLQFVLFLSFDNTYISKVL